LKVDSELRLRRWVAPYEAHERVLKTAGLVDFVDLVAIRESHKGRQAM
jgi:hypothetical protein